MGQSFPEAEREEAFDDPIPIDAGGPAFGLRQSGLQPACQPHRLQWPQQPEPPAHPHAL